MLSNEKSETAVINGGKCGYVDILPAAGRERNFGFFTIDRNGEKV